MPRYYQLWLVTGFYPFYSHSEQGEYFSGFNQVEDRTLKMTEICSRLTDADCNEF